MSVKYFDGANSVDIAGGITTAQVNEAIQDSTRVFVKANGQTARLYFDRVYDFTITVSYSTNYHVFGSITVPGKYLNDPANTVIYYRYTDDTETPLFTITNVTSSYVDVTFNHANTIITERLAKVV